MEAWICWSRTMVQVVRGHLVPMSWKYSFETSKNKMSEAIDVLAEGGGKRGMKRYLVTAEASALLQEHLLPRHLDGATGTCPGGPGIPRVDWSTQMAP